MLTAGQEETWVQSAQDKLGCQQGLPSQAAWIALVAQWMSRMPTAENPAGLAAVRDDLHRRLLDLGFAVTVQGAPPAQAVLCATRPPAQGTRWVGLFAHYDVELPGAEWTSEPFTPRLSQGRVYGRGIADNLGPLALRCLALAAARDRPLPGLLWIIQGEEEIGSPFAHQLFPHLDLPPVSLWIEETGYFEQDGTQRLLLRHPDPALASAVQVLSDLASADGRGQRVLDRYLNKAFGEARCPCLLHLVRGRPYVAIGPNDTRSRIHAADESLPLDTLDLSSRQFLRLLEEVARCP